MPFTADTIVKLYLLLAAVGAASASPPGLAAAAVLLVLLVVRGLAQRQLAQTALLAPASYDPRPRAGCSLARTIKDGPDEELA
jgi:hypothetical protein